MTKISELAQGGRTCFGDIWIFAKFLIGLHRVLSIPLFSIWAAHIYNVLNYNFKSVEVQGWTPLKILIFLHWTLRPTTFHYVSRKTPSRAISHWMGVPKTRGKCKSATTSLHYGDSLSMSSVVWTSTASHKGPLFEFLRKFASGCLSCFKKVENFGLGTVHKHLLGGAWCKKGGCLNIFNPCKGVLKKIITNFPVKIESTSRKC